MTRSGTPEGAVLRAVCEYLLRQERMGRLWFHRTNNAGTFDPTRGFYRKPNGAGYKDGVPDVECVVAPSVRYVAFECKAERGRQSETQKAAQAAVERMGGVYVVAR